MARDVDRASPGLAPQDFRAYVMVRCTPKIGPGDFLGGDRTYTFVGMRYEETGLLEHIDLAEISDTEEQCAEEVKLEKKRKSGAEDLRPLRRSTRLCVDK